MVIERADVVTSGTAKNLQRQALADKGQGQVADGIGSAACAVMGCEVEARDMGLSMGKMESSIPTDEGTSVRWIEAYAARYRRRPRGRCEATGSVYAEGSAAQLEDGAAWAWR